jgi:hypothetical protein
MRRAQVAVDPRSARHASQWASARWSNAVRAASKAVTMDDPPTQPLPETHELQEGECDFSNWLDRHDDVSMSQALTGLGFMLGVCYALYSGATAVARGTPPAFTLRELPHAATDMPTFKFDNGDPRVRK